MTDHYYSINPTSEIKEKYFTSCIENLSMKFVSVSGVFGFSDKIDKVSQLLIKNFNPSGTSILDIGCGYGAIGIYLKALNPQCFVTLSDINQRALHYCEKNLTFNQINCEIVNSNLFENFENRTFSDIVSNPPFAAGKQIYLKLINDSILYLEKNGALWLTAFHNKGGSTLKENMKNTFGNVEEITKEGGVRVYKSIKP